MPSVSIITPSYNRAELIGDTLNSVQNQTLVDWEHIIVDDGSTDSTKQVVRTYARRDERFKLIERDRAPKGACTCRNIGLNAAEGKYVLFLDSDDLLASYCLEQRISFMESGPELDIAIFPVLMFENTPNDLPYLWSNDTDKDELIRSLRGNPSCYTASNIWQASYLKDLGGFDESLTAWQDTDLHFRAFIADCAYERKFDIPPDVYFRTGETGVSTNNYFSEEKMGSRARVLKKAAVLLNQMGKDYLAPELRYLFAQVGNGAARSLHSDIAFDLCTSGKRMNVFTSQEMWILRIITVAHLFRLVKLPFVHELAQKAHRRFVRPKRLGKIPIEDTDVPPPPAFKSSVILDGTESPS